MRFMILCPTRSGSNLLMNLLNSHGDVKVHGELFSLDRLKFEVVQEMIMDPTTYLKSKLIIPDNSNIKGVGFKMLYDNFTLDYFHKEVNLSLANEQVQKRNTELEEFIYSTFEKEQLAHYFNRLWEYYRNDSNLRIIHLTRKNLLRSYISLKRAFLSDEWIRLSQKEYSEIEKITVEPRALARYFNRIQKFESHYDQYFSDHQVLKIHYEELVKDQNLTIGNVCDFLEIPTIGLRSVLKKQGGGNLEDNLHNHEELRMKFEDSPWSHFFDKK